MPFRIHACRGALFLLSVGLNNVDSTEALKAAIDKVVKPGFWNLPIFVVVIPSWSDSTIISQPGLVVGAVWQAKSRKIAVRLAPQHYRYFLLLPDVAQVLLRCDEIYLQKEYWLNSKNSKELKFRKFVVGRICAVV